MNRTLWAEQQKQALIDAGVNPLDAQQAVQWVIDNKPADADPDTWLPAPHHIVDLARDAQTGVTTDAKAYWHSHEAIPQRYNAILSAQPVADEEEGKDVGRDIAVGILLLWLFLRNRGQYATAKPFRAASLSSIHTLLDSSVAAEDMAIAATITGFHDGNIAPSTWHRYTQVQLRRLHLNYRALGAGGYAMLTSTDYQIIDAELVSDYTYLHRFAADIRDGNSTLAESQNRGGLYVGNARTEYWGALGSVLASIGFDDQVLLERRLLGPAEHCIDCLGYYDAGWQRAGTLPAPGQQSRCRQNCRCIKIYTTVPYTEIAAWIGTKRNASRFR